MKHPKLKEPNTLPDYWFIKHEDSPGFRKVIDFLNLINPYKWSGSGQKYYGYDGNSSYGGTEAHPIPERFENKAIEITVADFLKMTTPVPKEEIVSTYSIY